MPGAGCVAGVVLQVAQRGSVTGGKRRAELAAAIASLFAKHNGSYGSPRITADLRELGWRVGENTVARVMAEQGLVAGARPPARPPAGQIGAQGAGRAAPGLRPAPGAGRARGAVI